MFNIKSISISYLYVGVLALIISSCSEDAIDPVVDVQNLSQNEVKTILEADDYSKSFDSIISEVYLNDNSSGKSNNCYVPTYSDTGFTIAFEDCTIDGTENVNGILSVVYTGEGNDTSYMVSWEDFSYGDIIINGTRAYEIGSALQQSQIQFSVTSNLTMTLADGSEVKEMGTKEVSLSFGLSFENSVYTLAGSWSVVANGNTYEIDVDEHLEGNLACEYLVSGNMTVKKNGLEANVDFGNGECDDRATIEYPDGTVEEISLKD